MTHSNNPIIEALVHQRPFNFIGSPSKFEFKLWVNNRKLWR